ncbi:hypothetical protein MTO96_006616 [Rhipicephalus appendiculatus]
MPRCPLGYRAASATEAAGSRGGPGPKARGHHRWVLTPFRGSCSPNQRKGLARRCIFDEAAAPPAPQADAAANSTLQQKPAPAALLGRAAQHRQPA